MHSLWKDIHTSSSERCQDLFHPRDGFRYLPSRILDTPYVFYSSGTLEKYDYGRIAGSRDPWKGEERNFELRPVYYKKIDETEFASAYIQAKFIDAPTRDSITSGIWETSPAEGRPVARYVPFRAMDEFMRLAKENRLLYTFDYKGTLLAPTFSKIPVMTAGKDAPLLHSILAWIDERGFQEHWVHERNHPYLNDRMNHQELIRSASIHAAWTPDGEAGITAIQKAI